MFTLLLDLISFIFLLGASVIVIIGGLVIGTGVLILIDRFLTRWDK